MGRCKLTSICGHDYCCIECPENEVCKEQCDFFRLDCAKDSEVG